MIANRRVLSHLSTVRCSFSTSAGASTNAAPKPSPTVSPTKDGKKLRLVVAVGGNALQRRGERLTIENMLKAASEMAPVMAELAKTHELVLTHGNGPQVGELALERAAATFDVLGAESMGQVRGFYL